MRPSGANANEVMSSSMVRVGLSSDCAGVGSGRNRKERITQRRRVRRGAQSSQQKLRDGEVVLALIPRSEVAARRAGPETIAVGEKSLLIVIPSGARNPLFVLITAKSRFLGPNPPSG